MIPFSTLRCLLAGAFLTCFVLPVALAQKAAAPDPAVYSRLSETSPLLFTENRGQVADTKGSPRPDILFTAHSNGAQIYLSANAIHYQFSKGDVSRDAREASAQNLFSTHRFSVSLEGSNPAPRIRRESQSSFTENFYLAHCPAGITGVSTWGRIVYESVYPGIDWVVYSRDGGMKYDFIVHPGADYGRIRLKVSDADGVQISKDGALVMQTRLGEVREAPPVSFSAGRSISTQFTQQTNGTISFAVGAFDKKQPLTIDPTILWSTYYGSTSYDYGLSCATDPAGNVYLAGFTGSLSGIASGGFQNSKAGASDAYLVKFSTTGARLWATYYGGAGYDDAYSCATDGAGNVYLSGSTESPAGMASGGFQNTHAPGDAYDAFLAKFNSSGVRQWATYYGGTGADRSLNCAADGAGNIYLNGNTTSATDIASGGFQNTFGGNSDAFLVKFSPAGARLWATYYGGNAAEDAAGCITDGSGNVFLTGSTSSAGGIASGGFQNTFSGISDAFLVKFSSTGARIWGTYYGGSGNDLSRGCATEAGDVYVAGYTTSTTNIASGGFQNTAGGAGDGFLVKFDAAGNRLWGTFYGGASTDNGYSCASDPYGNVFLIGYTISTAGIASGGFQNTHAGGVQDVYVVKFSNAGVRLWATYFGGNAEDLGYSCATNALGHVYIAGNTASTSGIGNGGFQNSYGGPTTDAFLLKISDPPPSTIYTGTVTGSPFCGGAMLSIPFTTVGTFNPGNTYSVQLSNAAGSFTAPVVIGSITSNTSSGNIPSVIPVSTPAGTGYRVRIVSSSPAITGTNNGADLTIISAPSSPGPITGNTVACAGSGQTYSVAAVPGALYYTWTLPGTWTGSSTTNVITATAGQSGGTVSVTVTTACGTSQAATLQVIAGTQIPLTPSVTITSTSFCAGQPVVFTAAPVNGGPSPSYQWKRNGVPVGTNSPTYTDPVAQTGTTVSVEMTSNASCVSAAPVVSNTITETVSPSVVPGININTIPPATLCAGSPITFISNITGGGLSPQYRWYKNGVLLPGDTLANYTDAALQNGDTVQAVLISSEGCPVTPQTYSNKRGVTVLPLVQAAVSISAQPGTAGLTPGTPVTFTATYTGGGVTPFFTWRVNGVTVPGVTGPVYTTTYTGIAPGLRDGDEVSVRMASTDPCPSVALPVSNILKINPATGTSVSGGSGNRAGLFAVYPNPGPGRFTMQAALTPAHAGKIVRIGVYNTLGQQIYSREVVAGSAAFTVEVVLGGQVANGLYQLRISAGDMQTVFPVVVQR